MTEHSPIDRGFVLGSFQKAMLGAVTADLRIVTIDLADGVRVRFIYDRPVDDEIRDIVDDVETEMIADIFPDARVEAVIESQSDGPIATSDTEFYVFRRRET